MRCGNCTGSVKKERAPPKCTNECAIAKRNARLAEALGISTNDAAKADKVEYKDEVVAFGKANPKFVALVEKTFKEYAAGLAEWKGVSNRSQVHRVGQENASAPTYAS